MEDVNLIIKELHKVQYKILEEFNRVCQKHNIRYFLGFGSMLGAVRHQGFIPWDDDIDVLMMYDDFIKLQNIDPKEWSPGYFLQSSKTDKNYNKVFIKIRDSRTTLIVEDVKNKDINQGVAIDIEPLISLADNKIKRRKQYRETKLYMLLRYYEPPINHGWIMYYGGKLLLSLIPDKIKDKLKEKLLLNILQYEGEKTEYLYVMNGNIEMMRDLHRRRIFKDSIMMRFEEGLYPVPIGYDEWLGTRYGDYMKLPPEGQQGIKLNQFIKIDLSNPYYKYKGVLYCKNEKNTVHHCV